MKLKYFAINKIEQESQNNFFSSFLIPIQAS